MTRSSLCTYTHITGNRNSGRGGERVCKITPHYMAAKWTGRQCADYFASTNRQASSNYCIGYGGDIAMSVDEDDRAWTSSSGWNDRKAITIECANLPDSSLTDATWNALVNLCVDICRRYGFRLSYDGTSNGSLTEHRMFAATSCPGEWLHSRMGKLASEVNARLGGGGSSSGGSSSGPSAPSGSVTDLAKRAIAGEFGNGEARKAALGSRYAEVQAEVNRLLGQGGGSSSGGSSANIDQLARDVIAGKYGNGDARKRALGSNYAAVQARVNEMLGQGGGSSSVDIDALARAVIRGEYGNGEERKRRLGANYAAVQARVNQLM